MGRRTDCGLRTPEALRQLKKDVSERLRDFDRPAPPTSRFRLLDSLSPSNKRALVIWPTLCVAFAYGCALYYTYEVSDSNQIDRFLLFEASILWIFIFLNGYLVYNENKLSVNEIPKRIAYSLDELDKVIRECNWTEANYPHLCAPFSPCVTLQWTYRDGKIVNLPWALLVKGDIIVMRPGQEAPGKCEAVDNPSIAMLPQQIYQPPTVCKGDNFTIPRATQPHKSKLFKLTETPYISNLQLALERALDRPVTVHNKQRHLVNIKCIETFILPASIIIVLLAGFIRYFYLSEYIGTAHWTSVFILQLVATTFPLLPSIFPVIWIALNTYGIAEFKYLLQTSKKEEREKNSLGSQEIKNPLLPSQSSTLSQESDKTIWKMFLNLLIGQENFISRSANIVQVLGSVTALCCVDKKGILSWPNPTAEKVFFLRNSSDLSHSSSKASFMESSSHISTGNSQDNQIEIINKQQSSLNTMPHLNSITVAEVLDLTHDQNVPFGLEFDDHSWKNYIASLKPLGLAILVNTCNMDTQEHYSHFCAHLTCEATQSEDVVPVTNRRCLCELAKQIGFVEEAKNIYSLQNHLATYRHLPPDIIRRDTKFARSLHLSTRVKVPLPHMLSVIIKDQAGGLQLMSQGTADIILDSCIEYWNGQDLCILSPSDRKKVLDFYQRSSLTAYCSAFAYRPLTRGISTQLASMFLELPADCPSLYPPNIGWNDAHSPLTNLYHSTDSLLFSDPKDDDVTDVDGCFDLQCNQVFIGMVTMQYQAQKDMVELIERLDGACIRFVHFSKENELRSRVFSEKMGLESGWNCHISLSGDNNKPSSPTNSQNLHILQFSDKAWLKSGNVSQTSNQSGKNNDRGESCNGEIFMYSSLESSKPLSNSAPGAINLDHTTVKFGNETSQLRIDARNNSIVSQNLQNRQDSTLEGGDSQDSVLLQGWEGEDSSPPDGCRSLSCLTDSTDHSVPVNFDMRNRAKLPRGIENIRPHIEQVDNVPLLVSLFTDCTANTARRMIDIMQDYNEVVCVMGSAANKDNMEIFMQADASIAVEPLYPVLCQKVPPYQLPDKGIGPIDLARILNSIPCSISIPREADVSLFSLVTMARHFMLCLWNSTQFWLSAACSITVLQILSVVFALPMIMTVGNVMWLVLIVIPVISVTLMCLPIESAVMTRATYKHQNSVNVEVSLFIMWCYGCKFLPSILIVLFSYGSMLVTFCNQIVSVNNSSECIMMYPIIKNVSDENFGFGSNMEWSGWGDVYKEGYIISQQICFCMLFLLLVTISISFVHREHSLWQRNVFSNRIWMISVIFLSFLQFLYLGITWYLLKNESDEDSFSFNVPLPHIIIMLVSPILILSINEFIKWQEIKINLRYQRRARLDFGTKLGMNSPF